MSQGTNEENRARLNGIISRVHDAVEMCFELTDDLLANPETVEGVDRSIVLLEVVGDLRAVASRLELMQSRMAAEDVGSG